MTDYFTRKENKPDEKKILTNNKPSPARPKSNSKPAQSLKKKTKTSGVNEKKTVTQLRGFWTKFAEEQKKKKRNEEEITEKTRNNENKKKTQENKLASENTSTDVAYCKPAMNSCTLVRSDNPNIPEHSKRPAKARIKLKSENNCSGDSPKNRIRRL